MNEKDLKNLKAMQTKQLEILKEIDRVCRKNKISYYLSSGTCIGVLRHKGFIPWDDDIDMFMHWKDVDKLQTLQNEFASKYFIQTRKTDPHYPLTIMRICDSETACFEKDSLGISMNHGIFVDIYVLYPCPDNWFRRRKLVLDAYIYIILVANRPPKNRGKKYTFIGKQILALYRGKRRKKKIAQVEYSLRHNRGNKKLSIFFGGDFRGLDVISYRRECFSKPSEMQFEDFMALCPTNPEEYLSIRYGNYMKIPPVTEQNPHHEYVFMSTEESYKNFKGKYY